MNSEEDKSLPNERWLPVANYEELYDVSNLGRIRRINHGEAATEWHTISQEIDSRGYLITRLYKNGIRFRVRVHKLVAESFLGCCPEGLEVNHIDGDKANSSIENLEYITHIENILHAVRSGLMIGGRLLPDDVHEIRARLAAGEKQESIAADYCITRSAIAHISSGYRWSWLESPSAGRGVSRL